MFVISSVSISLTVVCLFLFIQCEPEELTLIHNLRKMLKNDWVKQALTSYNTSGFIQN